MKKSTIPIYSHTSTLDLYDMQNTSLTILSHQLRARQVILLLSTTSNMEIEESSRAIISVFCILIDSLLSADYNYLY